MRIDKRSLVAEVPAELLVERLEAGCLAQGVSPGPLTGADPQASLGDALLARVGRRSPKYGDIWDRVLSLEAELPGGRHVKAGGAPRAATGPDVNRTLLEARGRLGRILRVWLRLHPARRERLILRGEAPDLGTAVAALAAVLRAGVSPSLVDLEGTSGGASLIVSCEGEVGIAAAEASLARRTLERRGVTVGAPVSASPPELAGVVTATNAVLVEDCWARLPGRIAEVMAAAGGDLSGPASLVWLNHESAGLALPWPAGREKPATERPRAQQLQAELVAALHRRCA